MYNDLLGQKNARRADTRIDSGAALAIIISYYIIRFLIGTSAIALLFVFVGVAVYGAFRSRISSSAIVWYFPALMLPLSAVVTELGAHDHIAANYFIFTLSSMFILSISNIVFMPSKLINARWLVIFFILSISPFIISPSLEDHAAVTQLTEEPSMEIDEGPARLKAYFYHANELGIFSSAIFIYYFSCIKGQGFSPNKNKLDLVLCAVLFIITRYSDSFTGLFIFGMSAILFIIDSMMTRLVPLLIFTYLFVTQLYFAGRVADYLQRGSFYWRYGMAERIMTDSRLLNFMPGDIDTLESWPHSIIMDNVLCYGIFAAFLLFFCHAAFVFSRNGRHSMGWFSIFFVAASLQPVGASASFIALATVLGVATQKRPEPCSGHLKK